MGHSIAALSTLLNTQAHVFEKQIHQDLKVGLVTENYLAPVRTHGTYVSENIKATNLVQAYQWQFTPKGDYVHDAVENKLQRIKVDIQLTAEELDKYMDSYHAEWVEGGKPMKDWTFPKYLQMQVINPQIQEEMELEIAFKGVRVAPTPGAAGVTVASVDGLGKVIADAITATKITPIPTGALVANTMVNQLETFCDALPLAYRNAAGKIYMSPSNVDKYWRDFRDKFGTGNSNMGNDNNELRVDGTNKHIVGLPSMEGSDRIIFDASKVRNLIYGWKTGESSLPIIRWQEDERILKGLAEFSRFYGVRHWSHLFVNDQA